MSETNGHGNGNGNGQEQMDALKLFAYSRGVSGAPRPKLKLPGEGAPVGNFAMAFWEAVRERGVFRRDMHVVLINEVKNRLDFMEPHMVQVWADRMVDCYKVKPVELVGGEISFREVSKSMPVDVARSLLAQVKVEPQLLAEVEKVNYAPMPVLRKDGKTVELLKPGYDLESRTFTFDCGFRLDEEMTREEAVRYLRERHKEFPFGDGLDTPERSLAVQVACLVTLFASGLLPRGAARPIFVFNANAQRSGKSLLAKIVLLSIFGTAARASWSDNREEFRKNLDTSANTAAPYIFFDNVRGHIANADLEGFVTSPDVTFRVMGKNTEQSTVPNVTTVLITANQATMSTDIAERSLIVNLFVNEADPQARKIADPLDEVKIGNPDSRRRMLSALWAMVREWVKEGMPMNENSRLVGFEHWSGVVGGIVKAAGFVDPLERPNIAGVGDTLGQKMKELVTRLMTERLVTDDGEEMFTEIPGGRSYTFAQLARVCSIHGMFDEYVPDDGDMKASDRSKFGKFLKKYIGRSRVFSIKFGEMMERIELRDNGEGGRAKRFLLSQLDE